LPAPARYGPAYSLVYGLKQRYQAIRGWLSDMGGPAPQKYVGTDGLIHEMEGPPQREHTDALRVLVEVFLILATRKVVALLSRVPRQVVNLILSRRLHQLLRRTLKSLGRLAAPKPEKCRGWSTVEARQRHRI
jgi:hypothetical protein